MFVRDREIEGSGEREVIIVGGITFTSGPAWAKCYPVCVCVYVLGPAQFKAAQNNFKAEIGL